MQTILWCTYKNSRVFKLLELESLLDTNKYLKINSEPIYQQKTNRRYNFKTNKQTKKITLIIATKTWGTYKQCKFLWLFQSFIEAHNRPKINTIFMYRVGRLKDGNCPN